MSLYSILSITSSILLIAFSAAQIGLSSYVLHYTSKHSSPNDQTFGYPVPSLNVVRPMYFLPLVNLTRSYVLQVATGALGIVIGASVLGLAFRQGSYTFVGTGKRAPRSIAWPGLSSVLGLLLFLLALPTLVISLYDNTHFGISTFSISLCLVQHSYNTNSCGSTTTRLLLPVTVEGWTCSIRRSYARYNSNLTNNANDVIPKTCRISNVARWWTIALLIFPMILAGIALLELRRRNIIKYNAQQADSTGLYPKEQSFSSAATANSHMHSPVSPVSGLPQYSTIGSELHGNPKTSVEMGGKQVLEAPEKPEHGEMAGDKHQMYSELPASRSKVGLAQ